MWKPSENSCGMSRKCNGAKTKLSTKGRWQSGMGWWQRNEIWWNLNRKSEMKNRKLKQKTGKLNWTYCYAYPPCRHLKFENEYLKLKMHIWNFWIHIWDLRICIWNFRIPFEISQFAGESLDLPSEIALFPSEISQFPSEISEFLSEIWKLKISAPLEALYCTSGRGLFGFIFMRMRCHQVHNIQWYLLDSTGDTWRLTGAFARHMSMFVTSNDTSWILPETPGDSLEPLQDICRCSLHPMIPPGFCWTPGYSMEPLQTYVDVRYIQWYILDSARGTWRPAGDI